MAVFLAAFLLLQSAGALPGGAAAVAAAAPVVADTVLTDTLATDSLRRVGIARPDTVLPLPRVTVRARREALRAPRHVTTLTAADIEASGARSVAELLSAQTGLFVKRYGAGGLATLSSRGTSSRQTTVLIDGMRAADPQTGQVDLSLLPTLLLRSAEVVHGAAGARYGSGALGGVVRLHTLRPTRRLHADASGTLGAWGEQRAGIVVRGGGKRLTGLVAAEGSRAEGDFPYENKALQGTPQVARRGADRRAATLFGKARYVRDRSVLSLTGWYADAERGLPGTAGTAPSQARQWDRHLRLAARYTGQRPWGTVAATGRVQHTRRRYAGPAASDTARTARYALSAQAEAPLEALLGAQWTLAGGAEAAYDHAALRGGLGRGRGALFGDATADWGRLRVHPALRLDAYLSPEGARRVVALSPALGAGVQPLAWQGLRLKGRLARAFRAPTLNERFYQPGGNPDLKAEDGLSAEGGAALAAEHDRWSARAEATLFYTSLRDQIVWQPTIVAPGVRGWRPHNVARVRTRGLELSAGGHYRAGRALRLDAGLVYTRTAAEDRSNPATRAYGRQLPYVPRAQLKGHAGAAWRLPAHAGTLALRLSGRLVARRYVTADETQAVPAYRVFDARLRYGRTLGRVRATLGLAVENVTDRAYQVIRLYPMPPRHASLRLTFKTAP